MVQTNSKIVERCVLMTTDPGDLVLDPTCGSGTTAYVAEQWGRRWITMDTSRVALALARSRVMGARYPYYTLADSPEGQHEEARLAGTEPKSSPTYGDIRQGFVYQRVPHITLKAIANNTEIDVDLGTAPASGRVPRLLESERSALVGHPTRFPVIAVERGKRQTVDFTAHTAEIHRTPERRPRARERPARMGGSARGPGRLAVGSALGARRLLGSPHQVRQKEIDASIARKADFEYLYDKPVEDKTKIRVAGPFTVESLAPHRTLAVDEQDELIPQAAEPRAPYGTGQFGDFTAMIFENLRAAGIQQARKEDRIDFSSLSTVAR